MAEFTGPRAREEVSVIGIRPARECPGWGIIHVVHNHAVSSGNSFTTPSRVSAQATS